MIKIINYGNCKRDFTYIDDIVKGVVRVMQGAPEKENGVDGLPIPPHAVYNIGNSSPENLLDFVEILQQELVPMQPGDIPVTYAAHMLWNVISGLNQVLRYGTDCADLRSGISFFI